MDRLIIRKRCPQLILVIGMGMLGQGRLGRKEHLFFTLLLYWRIPAPHVDVRVFVLDQRSKLNWRGARGDNMREACGPASYLSGMGLDGVGQRHRLCAFASLRPTVAALTRLRPRH